MEGPYKLVNSLFAHDGPIRSVCLGPNGEIVTGCQADAPNIRRWSLTDPSTMSLEEIGSCIYHDHWVTALTSLKPDANRAFYPQGCIITGCMDSKIRIYDPQHGTLLATLIGHAKGIISFSWSINCSDNQLQYLLSGSWDGTVIIWDVALQVSVRQLGPHENGVHVLGLPSGLVATTSTGESVNGKPANFKLRLWDITTGQLVGSPIEDHTGSIRSVSALPGIGGFLTTGNDGMVMMRAADGQPIDSLFHKPQEDGSPPFILDSCALDSASGMDFVSCGEDGSIMVWSGAELVQSIPHPNTVWTVLALPNTDGDFITAGHDGVMRIFSRNNTKIDAPQAVQFQLEFLTEVDAAVSKKKKGPSSEEIAKAPKWENRGSIPGTSENQVMVFNKEGAMVAGQWMSGSWVLIGEVTGSGDGGYVNNQWYDHVMPVEIETPGGLMSLKLGVNNAENPFVAAQRFINENQLEQSYLSQIADWIVAHAGQQGPTLGTSSGGSAGAAATSSSSGGGGMSGYPTAHPPAPGAVAAMFSFTITAFAIYDEVPAANKLLPKLHEFNSMQTSTNTNSSNSNSSGSGSSAAQPQQQQQRQQLCQLTANDVSLIESMLQTLSNTAYYHASEISTEQVNTVLRPALHWQADQCFPLFDILRVIAIHPSGAEQLATQPLLRLLVERLISILQLEQGLDSLPLAPVLTAVRFCCNMFKVDALRAAIWQDPLLMHLIKALQRLTQHKNKLVRTAASRAATNISLFSATFGQFAHVTLGVHIVEELVSYSCAALSTETEQLEVIFNSLRVLGTLAKHFPSGDVQRCVHKIQQQNHDGLNIMQHINHNWAASGKLTSPVVNCLQEVTAMLV